MRNINVVERRASTSAVTPKWESAPPMGTDASAQQQGGESCVLLRAMFVAH